MLYAKVDHTSCDEFEPDKWGFIADATGVEEIAERAEAAATLAETNGTEAGLQAQAAKEAAEQATEQTEAAKAATGIFTENFKFVESVVHDVFPDVITCPYAMTGGTDGRHYSRISENVIRFAPLEINEQQYQSIHGLNENIGIECLEPGVAFYQNIIRDLYHQ